MQFTSEKNKQLERKDLSRKGSIDYRIIDLVNFINSQSNYITTSSCSGRTIVFTNSETKKKGCNWLFVSHDLFSEENIIDALNTHCGSAILKFEPFVLHTHCSTIESAQKLHRFGIEAGFKNSGMSIGKNGKIIVAIRSTLALEVPLSSEGNLLVSKEYISFLVSICNEKMLNNWQRIVRFYTKLQTINDPPIEASQHKKTQRTKPEKTVCQNAKKEPASPDTPLDLYYEGFHSFVNESDDNV